MENNDSIIFRSGLTMGGIELMALLSRITAEGGGNSDSFPPLAASILRLP